MIGTIIESLDEFKSSYSSQLETFEETFRAFSTTKNDTENDTSTNFGELVTSEKTIVEILKNDNSLNKIHDLILENRELNLKGFLQEALDSISNFQEICKKEKNPKYELSLLIKSLKDKLTNIENIETTMEGNGEKFKTLIDKLTKGSNFDEIQKQNNRKRKADSSLRRSGRKPKLIYNDEDSGDSNEEN